MISVAGWLKTRDDAHMLMQVHDELVFEVRADALQEVRREVIERMSGAAQLRVPLLVEAGVGTNWDEAH
jgi:DNA polymerase-1